MKILIINDLNDYQKEIKNHFSLTKGYYFGMGLSKLLKHRVYFLTTGKTSKDRNLTFINSKEITEEFLSDLNLLLLIKEGNLVKIMESYELIKDWIMNEHRPINQRVGIKSDSLSWVYSQGNIKDFNDKYNLNFVHFVAKQFDIIFVQTEEYKKFGYNILHQRFGKKVADKVNEKIFISRMGVPNELPFNNSLENPYDINHSYCIDNYYRLKRDESENNNNDKESKALHPLCYTLRNRPYSKKNIKDYNKSKTILIYMGRIKVDGGRILYLMSDIMKELGSEYELHIFPGRFELPDVDVKVFSPKYMDNLQTLRDTMFYKNDNVIIHVPYITETKTKWLQNADIGIDFSSSRPLNKRTEAGHAKLLEYCYYGLKVVAEKNICNSYLVEKADSGILLDNIGNVKEYVKAIREIREKEVNKIHTSKKTIEDSNWDKIALEFSNYLDMIKDPLLES